MFGLEPWHIVLLLAVVLVFFGPKRLPEIGKSVGETIREFRKATTDVANLVTGAPVPPAAAPTTVAAPASPQVEPPTSTSPVSPAAPDQPPVSVSIVAPAPPAAPASAPAAQPSVPALPDQPPAAVSVEPGAAQPAAADPNPPAGTAG